MKESETNWQRDEEKKRKRFPVQLKGGSISLQQREREGETRDEVRIAKTARGGGRERWKVDGGKDGGKEGVKAGDRKDGVKGGMIVEHRMEETGEEARGGGQKNSRGAGGEECIPMPLWEHKPLLIYYYCKAN